MIEPVLTGEREDMPYLRPGTSDGVNPYEQSSPDGGRVTAWRSHSTSVIGAATACHWQTRLGPHFSRAAVPDVFIAGAET
ncbi:hypothetical protein GCM10010145_66080 [Streptomyces ruber]|uniref:Uncharacterized protein n=2 Tax=Streptomyces TaxID=1883 RepID=A0A918BQT8_9ACTN|nr:hypothetical protein GCM10010145_66080 [Streptomyces ruber]